MTMIQWRGCHDDFYTKAASDNFFPKISWPYSFMTCDVDGAGCGVPFWDGIFTLDHFSSPIRHHGLDLQVASDAGGNGVRSSLVLTRDIQVLFSSIFC